MKKLQIAYWHLTKFKDLPWEHEDRFDYSKELRTAIIDECLEKGYSVMVRPMNKANGYDHDGELIWIDKGRFGQR